MKICDNTPGCIGFNSNGWLKNKCPGQEIVAGLTTYLLDSSTLRCSICTLVFVPSGEEPDVLLWPMPASYKSGDSVVAIDPLHIRFTANYFSEELRQATVRFKDMVFLRKLVSTPSSAINEVHIELMEKEVPFEVGSAPSLERRSRRTRATRCRCLKTVRRSRFARTTCTERTTR